MILKNIRKRHGAYKTRGESGSQPLEENIRAQPNSPVAASMEAAEWLYCSRAGKEKKRAKCKVINGKGKALRVCVCLLPSQSFHELTAAWGFSNKGSST